jgi:8-oxo-dGTP pyrophosphatase MutT (NUDIX family)
MSSRQKKKITYRAGVIPYFISSIGEIEMMFMKPSDGSYGGDCFQIAKGKVEEGESATAAAFREAHEELGLLKDNIVYSFELGTFLGYTTIFLAKVLNPNDFDDTCHETGETMWMTLEEFEKMGRGLHKSVVRDAVDFIKREEIDENYPR